MAEKKTHGGWAVPEPDFDPTSAPLPEPSPAEVQRPAEATVFPEREETKKTKKSE